MSDRFEALTRELAEAREVSAALVEQLRGLSAAHTSTVRDLRDRDHELSLANARGNRLQAQLTEARGELRRITESDFAHQIRLSRAVGDVKTTEVTIAALHAWRAKNSAAQSPSAKECDGPGCSYPDGCPKCNPLGTPTQSPSSADSDARNADPECINCGHVSSDHPRGEHCGACVDDEDGNSARCDCSRLIETQGKPASPPYETAPTLEKGVSNCEACNGDGDNGFFGTCLECGGEGVVRVESAPELPHNTTPVSEQYRAADEWSGEPCPQAGSRAVAELVAWAEAVSAHSPTGWPTLEEIRAALRPGDKGYEHKPDPSITRAETRPGFATAAELAEVARKVNVLWEAAGYDRSRK